MSFHPSQDSRLDWLTREDLRPFVFMRKDNHPSVPGSLHPCDWFSQPLLDLDPLKMENVEFANVLLRLESAAFESSDMAMPRWVFYDCAVVPGFVAGFAQHISKVSDKVKQKLIHGENLDWVPISLFIIIPTAAGEWVAHNLSSLNFMLDRTDRFYGLGFLTKAFGLWYANIKVNVGMTQWKSPAVSLHSHYGVFEVLTAYTPVHSYPKTMTYRLEPKVSYWELFFTKQQDEDFLNHYRAAGFQVHPTDDASLKLFQSRIEAGEGPFFLNSNEIRSQVRDQEWTVYRPI